MSGAALPWVADLIPSPVRCRLQPGTWTLDARAHIALPASATPDDRAAAAALAVACRGHAGRRPRVRPGAADVHRLWLGGPPEAADLEVRVPEPAEGYALEVSPRGVLLAGRDAAGLAHAVRTFTQMLRLRARGGARVPCVEVRDAPALPWRGVMVDVGRQVERPDYLEALMRDLAGYKKNLFMLYFEDKFRWRSRPELAHPLGYTAADFRRLAEVARSLHMAFVPALASLGHCEGLLRHPSLAALREEGSIYQLAMRKPGSRRLLRDLYGELLPLYPGRFFHINCDESPLLAGPPGSPPSFLEDSLRRFRDHVLFLRDLLAEHGKQALIWGDMLLHYPALAELLPRDLIVVDWDYGAMRRHRREAPAQFRAQGFEVWVAPAAGRSAEVGTPPFMQIADNVPRFIRTGYEDGARGELTTMWEMFTTNPLVLRPGLVASAQCGWAPTRIAPGRLPARVAAHLYGPAAAADTVAAWRKLSGDGFGRRYGEAHGGPEVPGYRTYHTDSHEIVPTDPMVYLTYDRQDWAASIGREARAGLLRLDAARKRARGGAGELEAYDVGGRLQAYQAALRTAVNAAGCAVVAAERARRAGHPGEAARRLETACRAIEDLGAQASDLARRVAATWRRTRYAHDPALQDIHLRRLGLARRALRGHAARLRRAQRRLRAGRDASLGAMLGGQRVLFYDAANPSDTLVDVWQQRVEGSDDGATWTTLMTKGWFIRQAERFAMAQILERDWLPRRIRLTTERLHIGPRRVPLRERLRLRVARTLTPAEILDGAPEADFRTCDARFCFRDDVGYRLARASGAVLEFVRTPDGD